MDRREFLRNASLASAGLPLLSVTRTPFESKSDHLEENLEELTILDIQSKMNSGQLSSEQLTRGYLERINRLDKAGPALNAILEINPDAMQIARQLDEERSSGKTRSPLHGIPVLIKDNINTADKMMTTAGSIALLNNHAEHDAFVVKKLRDAGAVILGKTNLTEWSNFRSARPVSGWSSRGGQTKNACVLDRNPSGSSSGSAVAVAANLCAVAIGTETNGSVISPAAHNGIVGIKPTVGLVSRSGIIPISSTQDTAGPLTRSVTDAAILLNVICGSDVSDTTTLGIEGYIGDYTRNLKKDELKGKRIGIEQSHLKGHEKVTSVFRDAIEDLKAQGATIVETNLLKRFADFKYPQYTLFLYEFKDGINKYLSTTKGEIRTLENLIDFNKRNESKTMPFFRQEIFEEAQNMGDLKKQEYLTIIQQRRQLQKLVSKIFEDENLDCICGVSTGLPGNIDLVNGDYDTGYYFCSPAAATGYPHITVPMGKVHHLPLGLSFMGKAWAEADLLGLAYAYEQASRKRQIQHFLPTVPSA